MPRLAPPIALARGQWFEPAQAGGVAPLISTISADGRTAARKQLRATRRGLSITQRRQAASGLLRRVTRDPAWRNARNIGLFWPCDGEIDVRPLWATAWREQRRVFIPIISANGHMRFSLVTPRTMLVANKFGIPEPAAGHRMYLPATQLHLVLVPLVGFDASGNRIGMGGGYYDRCFARQISMARSRPLLAGVAFDTQRVGHIETESWDVPLRRVFTERHCYRCAP